jgi:hypothetical protein
MWEMFQEAYNVELTDAGNFIVRTRVELRVGGLCNETAH